ncbi:YbdD/YjiX family protein [Candidatus Magnetaquicoccus inordinatus]|uniref:YbdD/YjiX family protein n=1 Tax=Candidatus Magnetaquicoccus inordinatus TaxID=2496818 RepID=UPI00102D1944|nr:YbdD/YjiX family protein [Candidatus Magnetaquicoccus inordinatus]
MPWLRSSALLVNNCYSLLKEMARAMIGLPDYQLYVAHRQQQHPGQPILSEAEFIQERQEARYGKGGRNKIIRCC